MVAASGTVQRPAVVFTSSQTGAASSFSLVTSALWGASGNSLYCFIQNAPYFASSATHSSWVTYDCTGDNATGAIINVARLTGMSKWGLDAVRQSAVSSNNAASSRPIVTLSSQSFTTSAILGIVGANSTFSAGFLCPGGFSSLANTVYISPSTAAFFCGNVGSNSTVFGWSTSTSSLNGAMIVEFKADAAPEMDIQSGALFYQHYSY